MYSGDPRSTGIPPGIPDSGTTPLPSDLDESRRRLLLTNAALLALGLIASTLVPGVAQTRIGGNFTVGLLWGFAQITLFGVTAWWCARRFAHPVDTDPGADADAAVRATGSAGDHEGRRWGR
ncbi:hypothetical protein [Streptomyces sp. NPDC058745]|uniref:hypothetical protein n=1 Tax=Streptomyces sp. NPDC058745 TaxID=3346621 RepID=UPI003681CA3F